MAVCALVTSSACLPSVPPTLLLVFPLSVRHIVCLCGDACGYGAAPFSRMCSAGATRRAVVPTYLPKPLQLKKCVARVVPGDPGPLTPVALPRALSPAATRGKLAPQCAAAEPWRLVLFGCVGQTSKAAL